MGEACEEGKKEEAVGRKEDNLRDCIHWNFIYNNGPEKSAIIYFQQKLHFNNVWILKMELHIFLVYTVVICNCDLQSGSFNLNLIVDTCNLY